MMKDRKNFSPEGLLHEAPFQLRLGRMGFSGVDGGGKYKRRSKVNYGSIQHEKTNRETRVLHEQRQAHKVSCL